VEKEKQYEIRYLLHDTMDSNVSEAQTASIFKVEVVEM
jgi:hypothetical protein